MADSKYYIILAGVDGIGKTTLHKTAPELFYHSRLLTPDNVIHLDQDALSKGEKQCIEKISLKDKVLQAIQENDSFYYETTLSEDISVQKELLEIAKESGYITILYYIDTDDLDTIYHRNLKQSRVIPSGKLEDIQNLSQTHLFELMNCTDHVIVFDNTEYFEIVQMKWNKLDS